MRRAGEFLLGGALVYVAMAANAAGCAGSSPDDGPLGAAGQGGAPAAQAGASGGPAGQAGAVAQAGASGEGGGGGGILDPVPDANAATPGARLKPKVIVGADGSRQPTTLWFDTQRNEECAFRLAGDGVQRCLPTSAPVATGFYNSSCNKPFFAVPPAGTCGAKPLPALVSAVDFCTGGTRIYHPGNPLGPNETPSVGTPGACYVTPPGAYPGYVFYHLAAEVPLESFVSASVEAQP